MHVVSYSAHNVLRCSDISFDLSGRHLFLVGGKNGEGKTSSIRALLMAICGRSGMDYPEPALKEGEDEGWVRVKLTGDPALHEDDHLTVELYMKRGRGGQIAEQFRVLDSTGEEAPEPRKLLKRLYENKAFDPLAFDRMKKGERRTVLMQLVGLDLDKYQADRKDLYAKRKSVNAEGTTKKAKIDEMPFHDTAPAEEVDVSDLTDELEAAREHNSAVEAARKNHVEAQRLEAYAAEKVEELKRQLAEAEEALAATQTATTDAKTALDGIGEEIDTSTITQQIKDAGNINKAVAQNQRRKEAEKELEELRDKSRKLTDKIKKLDADQDKALAQANWPLPGMSVDDEGVLVDGLPYENASKSRRIATSVNVGIALNPTLRLLVCEDGSDLDTDTLAALEQTLQANDFQMLVEIVTRGQDDEDLCAVVINDGAVAVENQPTNGDSDE